MGDWLTPSGSHRYGDHSPTPSVTSSILPRSSSTGDMELSPDSITDYSLSPPTGDSEDQFVALAHHVSRFSNALGGLKSVIVSQSVSGKFPLCRYLCTNYV